MNKEQILQELSQLINTGQISREEVARRLALSVAPVEVKESVAEKHSANISVAKALYIIGGVIVLIGVIYFVANLWNEIGSVGRIVVTLGLGLVFTLVGSVLSKQKPGQLIGPVFHSIGGLLIPGGAVVTLVELNSDIDSLWSVAITFGVIFIFYLLLNIANKNPVLTFFAVANGTAFVYLLVGAMLSPYPYGSDDIYAYLTMLVGVSYILLAHSFRGGANDKLVGILRFFGTIALLGAAFTRIFNEPLWQVVYLLLIFGGMFLSTRLKSRSVLFLSTAFLIGYISYITGEYFADSVGWPISMIVLGLIIIGLGYAAVSINRKYIRTA